MAFGQWKAPKFGEPIGSSNGLTGNIDALSGANVDIPMAKPKMGILQRIGIGLNSFAPVTAFYKWNYEDKNFFKEYLSNAYKSVTSAITGYGDEEFPASQKSGKDVLVREGMSDTAGKVDASDVYGLAIDIFTDPTTYISAGAAKVAGKAVVSEAGEKVFFKAAGKQLLDESIEQFGTSIPRTAIKKEVARYAIEEAPELIAEQGIRFMGKTIVPQKLLKKLGMGGVGESGLVKGTATSLLDLGEKIPVAGSKIGAGREFLNTLWDPRYSSGLMNYGEEVADDMSELLGVTKNKLYGKSFKETEELMGWIKEAMDEGVDAKQIQDIIETGGESVLKAQKGKTVNTLTGEVIENTEKPVARGIVEKAADTFEGIKYYNLSSGKSQVDIAVDENGIGWLTNLSTKSGLEGKGNATEIARDGVARLQNRGVREIRVVPENDASKAIFKKLGFADNGREWTLSQPTKGVTKESNRLLGRLEKDQKAGIDKFISKFVGKGDETAETIEKSDSFNYVKQTILDKVQPSKRAETENFLEAWSKVSPEDTATKGVLNTVKERIEAETGIKIPDLNGASVKLNIDKKKLATTLGREATDEEIGALSIFAKTEGKFTNKFMAAKSSYMDAVRTKGEKLLTGESVYTDQMISREFNKTMYDLGIKKFKEFKEIKTGVDAMDKIANTLRKRYKDMEIDEYFRGIDYKEIENYAHHTLTKEAREEMFGGGMKTEVSKDIEEHIEKLKKLGAAESRRLQGTTKEINQAMRDKYNLGYDVFDENAFVAFGKRQIQHINATKFSELADPLVSNYGVPAKKAIKESIDAGGNKIVKESYEDALIDGTKYIQVKNAKGDAVKAFEGILLPEELAQSVSKMYATLSDGNTLNRFLKLYDKAMFAWKGSVTVYFPAFHMRNMIGGTFNNWLAGVDNPLRYVEARTILNGAEGEILDKTGRKISYAEIRDELINRGVTKQTGYFDVNETAQDLLERAGRGKTKEKLTTRTMEAVESQLRVPLFINELYKGNSFQGALEQVNKFHFDYGKEAMTPFENDIVKRFIPFYTWSRNNIPLQLEQIGKQPGKYNALFKTMNTLSGAGQTREQQSEERKYMPEWMNDMLQVRLPGEDPKYMQIDLPVEDISNINFKNMFGLLAPWIKAPIELGFNKNVFMDSPIYNPDLPREMQTAKASSLMGYIPEPVKGLLNIRESEVTNPFTGKTDKRYEMDARALYVVRSAVGRIYSSADNVFGETSTTEKFAKNIMGTPIRSLDIEAQKYYAAKDYERKITEMLE